MSAADIQKGLRKNAIAQIANTSAPSIRRLFDHVLYCTIGSVVFTLSRSMTLEQSLKDCLNITRVMASVSYLDLIKPLVYSTSASNLGLSRRKRQAHSKTDALTTFDINTSSLCTTTTPRSCLQSTRYDRTNSLASMSPYRLRL